MWASGILPVLGMCSLMCRYWVGRRSFRICSSWNSPYSPRPRVTLKRFSRFCVAFWMSLALSFIAPMSWSMPSSFQQVAIAPLTVASSTEIFPSLPDNRNKMTSMTRTRSITKAMRSSINATTRCLILSVNCILENINCYESVHSIWDADFAYSFYLNGSSCIRLSLMLL